MDLREGAKRMRKTGRWLTTVPLALLAVLVLVTGILELAGKDILSPGLGMMALCVLSALGGVLWLAGWILDGFTKDPA